MGNNNPSNQVNADIQQKSARVIGRPFPKGVSGNPAGRPKRKTLTELIHAKLDETPGAWDAIVGTVIQKILKDKEKEVLKTFWQYTDGMPKQGLELTGKDGGAIKVIPIMGATANVSEDESLRQTPNTD